MRTKNRKPWLAVPTPTARLMKLIQQLVMIRQRQRSAPQVILIVHLPQVKTMLNLLLHQHQTMMLLMIGVLLQTKALAKQTPAKAIPTIVNHLRKNCHLSMAIALFSQNHLSGWILLVKCLLMLITPKWLNLTQILGNSFNHKSLPLKRTLLMGVVLVLLGSMSELRTNFQN